jgi:hypothetical protein
VQRLKLPKLTNNHVKKRLCLFFLPLAFLACTPEEEENKPADLVPTDKMTRILIDVHLTEASIGRTIRNFDTSRVAYKQAHKLVLKRHHVSDSAFKHSYDYYLLHPALLDKIYDNVLDSLSLREAKLTEKAVPDSAAIPPQTTVPVKDTTAKDTAKAK